MAISQINGGICGFTTKVTSTDEGGKIKLSIETDCPNVKKLAEELTEVDPFNEVFKRATSTKTYELASKHLPHPACIVPCGILKAVEIEANLALPKDASVQVNKS
ncbi:MAG: hypothetical protein KGZ94_11175 [Clostridia bacterium]|uniref:DUF6951 family protein n=1 Tax=Desulfitibacter alkalitolerans TaxID=264641 RepID=UPI0004806A98|nr:hypothetical protein [Desulfitibacter alkalitolerans]MBS3970659.1 hypothetical protein [Clostridia bacterium]